MMDFHAVTLRQCCHPTSSPETSVKNCYSTLRNIPEECRSQAVFVPTIQKFVVKHFLLLAATLQQMAVVLCCCVNTVRHCATLRDTARHCATLRDTARHCATLCDTVRHCATLGELLCKNQIGYCLPRDVIRGLYQGVLYFQNVTQVHGTRVNVISFTPTRKVRPSLWRFSRKSHSSNKFLLISAKNFVFIK